MLLKLDKNIDLPKVKFDLKCQIDNGFCKNNYPFEINLIYKIIHEHTNYESYQWQLFGNDKKIVDKEIQSLLIAISALDTSLTWDCLSVLSRYRNLYKLRNISSELSNNIKIIDSPGMRDIELIKYSKDKIIKGFSEILKSSKDCKFNNCNHINNDGCNVIKDLLDGVIDKSRYNNFIKFRDS